MTWCASNNYRISSSDCSKSVCSRRERHDRFVKQSSGCSSKLTPDPKRLLNSQQHHRSLVRHQRRAQRGLEFHRAFRKAQW